MAKRCKHPFCRQHAHGKLQLLVKLRAARFSRLSWQPVNRGNIIRMNKNLFISIKFGSSDKCVVNS